MNAPVRRARQVRWIAAAAAVLALGSLVIGIWTGDDGRPAAAPRGTDVASSPSSPLPGSSTPESSTGPADPGAAVGTATDPSVDPPPQGAALPAGFTLRAGHARRPAEPTVVADGRPLGTDRVAQILDRLPDWTSGDADRQAFRWPTQSRKPPTGGTEAEMPFPGGSSSTKPPAPPETDRGPLKVLRMQPQGAVSIAPFISITFDRPMVPVSTVGQLADGTAPATISPRVPGSWQWIGTRTARFAPDTATGGTDRLPMATDFVVTVPAGTRAADGAELTAAQTFRFNTPPPSVKDLAPTGKSLPLDPVFVAVFDQRVDPQAVLARTTLSADGEQRPIRPATDAEIAADARAGEVISAAPRGRAVAFRAADDLPVDAALTVTFAEGTPSAEGPRSSTRAASYHGHTHTDLTLTKAHCQWGRCEPGSPLALEFSNAIDADAFDPTSVTITPELSGAVVTAQGNTIVVQGPTAAATEYAVTVPKGLTDVFGQQLAMPATGKVSIGAARPRLDPFPQPVTTLDPMVERPLVTVNTVNRTEFRERVFAVSPDDWPDYQIFYRALQQSYGHAEPTVPDWPVLADRVVHVKGPSDRLVSTSLDLSGALSDSGSGHVIVLIEPTGADSFSAEERWQNAPTVSWVQRTTMSLDAISDSSQLRAWVTDLRDGSPVPGVSVTPILGPGPGIDTEHTVVTDTDGLATLPLRHTSMGALLATKGEQTAVLPSSMWGGDWTAQPQPDRLLWYVNDDRQTYRPGETVSVKGWVRRQGADTAATLSTLPDDVGVTYTATDAYGTRIGSGTAELSPLGGFDFSLDIPAGANLGAAWIQLGVSGIVIPGGESGDHSFRIADFRTPDFEVATQIDSSAPAVVGDDFTVAAVATYYAGGPLGDATVGWQVRTAAADYSPPGWNGFTFGRWTPWWVEDSAGGYGSGPASSDGCCGPVDPGASDVQTYSGTTDGNGSDYLQVRVGDLGEKYTGLPVSLTAQATVTDVNRQQIADTADILVHPADYYVGLAGEQTFVTQGQDLTVRAIATDIDGAAVPGRDLDIRAARVTSTRVNGESVDSLSDTQTCTVTSAKRPVDCTFTPTEAGTYRITATVTDADGRISRSRLTRWVAGPDGGTDRTVTEQQVTIVPDQRTYRPGQSAKLLVQSPISSGSGLLTVTHNGIIDTRRFEVSDGYAVVELPIEIDDLPGVTASVEVVGTVPRQPDAAASGPQRPAYATGQIDLQVSTAAKQLTVSATPQQKTVAPGGSTKLDVTVTDQHGNPVPHSEFEVIVADEAVLAVGGYQVPDPMDAFYPDLYDWITTSYGRATVMLTDVPQPAEQESAGESASAAAATGAAGGAAADSAAPEAASREMSADGMGEARKPAAGRQTAGDITDRTDFSPLALFVPSASTDADGHAVIDVSLPDNLTRYRVMVVAVAGADRFGTAESTITAGLPITVRPSGPDFLNFGDELELPVLVQNTTDSDRQVDVVLQTANLTIDGPAGKRVSVPAGDRVEVRFAVAADKAGTARYRVAVVSGEASDAATTELPVYTPATTESFATYGTVDGGAVAAQQLTAPTGVVRQYGGLQISTSSTALQQLTDAVDYLADYDYTSSDALAAQVIAIGSLGDVLQAFSAPDLPSPDKLRTLVAADVDKLTALQNDDGGFPYWTRGRPSDPFNSIQATQALLVAADYGAHVPDGVLQRAEKYLANIDRHIPADASRSTKDTLRAYAMNVLAAAGHADADAAAALVAARGDALPLDAAAWLLPVVDDPDSRADLLRRIGNAAVDDAGSVTFAGHVADDAWTTLQSDVRTDALILDALITVQPDSDLIGRTVAGLMGVQRGGRWNNVQENAFVLLALRHYYDTFESTSPDFVAGIWLGDRFAGQHAFRGHTTERATVTIPTADLGTGTTAVTLQNDGTGTLFYRLGLKTAPADLDLDPLDRGFVVARSYVGADDPNDVTRDADGTWHIEAGARVRVQLDLVSRSAHPHVALVDPLPAGLQILNPALATTSRDLDPRAGRDHAGDAPAGTGDARPAPMSWRATWFDHQNLRSDRAEAFASWLQGGVYSYSYLARATTPGSFVAPPARAEMMYAPETFGRAGTDRVVIEG